MNELLERLMDLQTLGLGGEGVTLGFERPIPAWAWGGIVGAAALASLWSYWRLEGSVWFRAVLSMSRAALLVLLVFLISGPRLVKRSESVEKDWVLVLVDRSASMTIADATPLGAGEEAGATGGTVAREEQLRVALERSAPMWRELSKDREVVWLGFDGGAFDLPAGTDEDMPVGLSEPRGRATALGPALEQALARAAARPLSAVVVLSDGRTVSEPSRAMVRRLQSERVPVHSVALGSADPVGDVAIRRVDAPRQAFVTDQTPVVVEVERGSGSAATGARVKLVDQATGIVLDERRAEFEGESASVILTTSAEDAGSRTWRVVIEPDGPDLIAGNNSAEAAIELVDRPLRVLYIDGYPRWEQRYLKNLLLRERSINCSTLILAPDRRYIQESDTEIDSLPQSIEEWAEYDAVILGDVLPDVFTEEQLMQLREHVARRGGGLVWIAGEAAVPSAWWESPLAELFPFQRSATDGGGIGEPVTLEPTESARRLRLLQLGESADEPWPAELGDSSLGWSSLRWVQRLDPRALKPTAEVLAQSQPAQTPVVLSMRYGAGRVLYVATDEIWRWRFGRGEVLPERFWMQMIRLLGREGLSRSGRSAVLEVAPRRADVGSPVRVSVELLDQILAEQAPASVEVRLTRTPEPGDPDDQPPTTVELSLRPEGEGRRSFASIWIGDEPGRWKAETLEPLLNALNLSAEAQLILPDDELRRPETDHGLLSRLSSETGGQSLSVANVAEVSDHLPNRRRRLLDEVTESLWDTPLALMLVVALATFEWVGRRVIRLI